MPIKFDPKVLRFRGDGGRFVKRSAVTQALDSARDEVKIRLKRLGEQLQRKEINLPQFAISARDELKALHVLSGGIAHGGKAQLSPAILGRLGAVTREQYAFLNGMVRQIANGQQPLNGSFFQRLNLYVSASHSTFVESERRLYRNAGFDEEMNVLHAAEHCSECSAEASRGWVPIGTLSKIGSRICRVNDRCSLEFRKVA